MKRMELLLALLLVLFFTAGAEVEPNITFTAPTNNSELQINSTVVIRWTHSSYYDAHPGNVCLVIGDTCFNVQPTADQFEWIVGKRANGTYLPAGQHIISMEDTDYWSTSKVVIKLYNAEQPNITFTAPANNSQLQINSKVVIRWTHSAYFDAHPEYVTLAISDAYFNVQPTADQFEWTVGKRANGTYLLAGQHVISIEDIDYWSTSKVSITLINAELPSISFKAPNDNSWLQIDSTAAIRWTHNPYYDAHPRNVTLVIGAASFTVPATADHFEWRVGRRVDGTCLPAGQHVIRMEDGDYQSTSKVNVKLYSIELLNKKLVARMSSGPQTGFMIRLDQVQLNLQGISAVYASLYHNNRLLADLGEFRPGVVPNGLVRIRLDQLSTKPLDLLHCELRFHIPKQMLRHSVPVQLVLEAPVLKKGRH